MSNAPCTASVNNIHNLKQSSGRCGCCALTCGYILPCFAGSVILALATAHVAFFCFLMHYYQDALHLSLSILFIVFELPLVGLVYWSFLQVIRTVPGYVQPVPWRNPPLYNPDRLLAARNDNTPPAPNVQNLNQCQPRPDSNYSNANCLRNTPNEKEVVQGGNEEVGPSLSNVPCQTVEEEPQAEIAEEEVQPLTTEPQPVIAPVVIGVVSMLDHSSGGLRHCSYCKLYKPDFAHHCQICRRCVYRMDHHCPWVNNCVGRNNYKVFLDFLFYLWVSWGLSAVLLAIGLFALDHNNHMEQILWYTALMLSAVLAGSFFLFYLQHKVGAMRGRSTMDTAIRRRVKRTMEKTRGLDDTARHEEASLQELKNAHIAEFRRVLFGNDKRFWRRWLPFSIRTDNNMD